MKIVKQQKGGIIFFQTKILDELANFYIQKVGCSLWLDQGRCEIFQFENMLFGFCQRENVDHLGMITFYYSTREEVDQKYLQLKSIAADNSKDNPQYKIYHFYSKDPEGRNIEFQHFWDV